MTKNENGQRLIKYYSAAPTASEELKHILQDISIKVIFHMLHAQFLTIQYRTYVLAQDCVFCKVLCGHIHYNFIRVALSAGMSNKYGLGLSYFDSTESSKGIPLLHRKKGPHSD